MERTSPALVKERLADFSAPTVQGKAQPRLSLHPRTFNSLTDAMLWFSHESICGITKRGSARFGDESSNVSRLCRSNSSIIEVWLRRADARTTTAGGRRDCGT